ncbi:unnamed protein product [Adineta ricciae]|nr:unnamed protein product [Adineta ricciae]
MGNTHSDSLNHSFKRLRMSETQQLLQMSPVSISPKRKTTQSNAQYSDQIAIEYNNKSIGETPIISCDDSHQVVLSTTTDPKDLPTVATNQYMNLLPHEQLVLCNTQLFAKSIAIDHRNEVVGSELSDEELVMCLRSKTSFFCLSDEDVLRCLTEACCITKN